MIPKYELRFADIAFCYFPCLARMYCSVSQLSFCSSSALSLNPYVSSISLIENTPFSDLLNDCAKLGMIIAAYTCAMKDSKVLIKHRVPIEMEIVWHGEQSC